jgi:hypothetical protein
MLLLATIDLPRGEAYLLSAKIITGAVKHQTYFTGLAKQRTE